MLEWWWRFSGRGKRWRAGSQRCLVAGAGEWELWESTIGREGNHLLGGEMAGATRTGELGTGNWERIDVPPSWEGGNDPSYQISLVFRRGFWGQRSAAWSTLHPVQPGQWGRPLGAATLGCAAPPQRKERRFLSAVAVVLSVLTKYATEGGKSS